jgi:hypothetical protein
MTNSTADRLVDHYLTRLADAAQVLPPDRRTELVSEIQEHITASMSGGTGADETAVRSMLDRLGDPDGIVAAALELDPSEHPYPQTPQRRQPGIGLEVGAVIMLTAGSLIPLFGWLIGVILLWSSGRWRRSEKVLGTLIFPGGPGLAMFYLPALFMWIDLSGRACPATGVTSTGRALPAVGACTSSGSPLGTVLGVTLLFFILVAPLVVAIVLLNRARRRAALERQ